MLTPVRLQIPGKFGPLIRTCSELFPNWVFILLADGMGGARGGERASQLAVETVAEIWQVAAPGRRRIAGRGGRSQPARAA